MGNHILHNRIWFGHHWDLHKETIWIPLIIFPSRNQQKIMISNIIENIDFMPTILDILNINYKSLMQEKSFSHCFQNLNCNTKSMAFTQAGAKKSMSVISHHYHLIINYLTNENELYNLSEGYKEQHNIIQENLDIYRKYLDAIELFKINNDRISRILINKWNRNKQGLTPNEINELKALGYIR